MFGNLFNKTKPLEVPDKKLSPAITDTILHAVGLRTIPPMHGAAQKAFEISTNPSAAARDFVAVIEGDEALAARVLKISNSVYFDRGKRSETIEEAVNLIGLNELRSLLNVSTLSEIFPSRHPARTQLWINDIATALVSRTIAEKLQPAKKEIAFLGGLMHDIGKLLLVQRTGSEYKKALELVQSRGDDFITSEEEVFEFNHTDVGQIVAERWNFTAELTEIIRDHHRSLAELERTGKTLTAIVQCADTICHSLGLGHPRGYTSFQDHARARLEGVWAFLKISATSQREFLTQCEKTYTTERDIYDSNGGEAACSE